MYRLKGGKEGRRGIGSCFQMPPTWYLVPSWISHYQCTTFALSLITSSPPTTPSPSSLSTHFTISLPPFITIPSPPSLSTHFTISLPTSPYHHLTPSPPRYLLLYLVSVLKTAFSTTSITTLCVCICLQHRVKVAATGEVVEVSDDDIEKVNCVRE